MANQVLLISALCSSICHLYAFLQTTRLPSNYYSLFILLALGTSIWNHAATSEIAKWSDRVVMGCGTIITYTIAPVQATYGMPIVISSYFGAKIFKHNIFHICAHATITAINMYIILYGNV
jgi:hypothetical protein